MTVFTCTKNMTTNMFLKYALYTNLCMKVHTTLVIAPLAFNLSIHQSGLAFTN